MDRVPSPPSPKYNVDSSGPDPSESGKNSASSTLYWGGGGIDERSRIDQCKRLCVSICLILLAKFFPPTV